MARLVTPVGGLGPPDFVSKKTGDDHEFYFLCEQPPRSQHERLLALAHPNGSCEPAVRGMTKRRPVYRNADSGSRGIKPDLLTRSMD